MPPRTDVHAGFRKPLLWLLAGLVGLGVGILIVRQRVARHRYSPVARLEFAARALADVSGSDPTVTLPRPGGHLQLPPLSAYMTPAKMAAMAVKLHTNQFKDAAAAATALRAALKVSPPRGRVLLSALQAGGSLDAAALSVRNLDRLVDIAWDAAAWPAARETLIQQQGLTPEQALALRAEICRRAVASTFESNRGCQHTAEAVGRFADLAPAQSRGFLRLAGALELLRAGPQALPALDALAQEQPEAAGFLRQAILSPTDSPGP